MRHHLTHGVSLWLCETHRRESYLRCNGGRDFVDRITTVWAAVDALTSRRRAALRAYLRRLGAPPHRELPGSYSWPALRREAERRFAAGEAPNTVITELRETYADGPSIVPSLRTMRRWFAQARWLLASPRDANEERTTSQRTGPLSPREKLVNFLLSGYLHAPRHEAQLIRGP
jgi:hypothetical protein